MAQGRGIRAATVMNEDQGHARQLADDLWVIDTVFQGEPGVIASYLLTGRYGLALVDVGSAVTVDRLLAGVRAAGYAPEAIEHLVLTHVHLDHAGAAGALLRQMPRARVYVHPLGAPHLTDPARLVESAARIYGEQMQHLWGTVTPVPRERITVLADEEEVRAGERVLRALFTPGHAVHHIAYVDTVRSVAFVGDVAGVRLQDLAYVRPPTPPPDLNLEDWFASLDRLATYRLHAAYLAHFGVMGDVRWGFDELSHRLSAWGELMLAGMRAGKDDQALAEDLAASANPELARVARDAEALRRYELATNYRMSAQGYVRYYRKYHPELLR